MRSGMRVCAMAYKSGLSALADKPVSGDLPGVRDLFGLNPDGTGATLAGANAHGW